MTVSWCRGGRTRSPWRFGAPGGEYATVLRVTAVGFVVLVLGRVVVLSGAAVTVGSVVLPGVVRDVVAGVVVVVVVVVRGARPGGTEIAGGAPVVGGSGGTGGTGTVCGPTVVGVVGGAVVAVVV